MLIALLLATLTFDDTLSLRQAARPRISPDGRLVAYEIAETDWKNNAYVTNLWLADVQSGRSVQLTRGRKSSMQAQWSPDGRWIAFLTERESTAAKDDDGKPDPKQLWLIAPGGGEAWQLSKHGAAIDSFRWSHDGKRIAFVAPLPETKTAKERKETYSDFEVFEEDYEQNQLWIIDVAAAERDGQPAAATQITSDAKVNVDDVEWSPDDTKIAFEGTANPLLAFGHTSDVYLADLANKNTVTRIVALEGPDNNPHFSPDGTQLAFNTALARPFFFYTNDHIGTVRVADVLAKPATKPEDVVDVSTNFDEDATLLEWSPDGILFRGLVKTTSHLFRIDPKTKAVTRLTSPEAFYLSDVSFTRDFKSFAYTAADATHLTEVYAGGRKLTDMTAQLTGKTVGSVELVSWKSKDGATVEGVLHKPADFDPAKKYPLFLVIHGGPTGVSRPVLGFSRYYPVEQFLAKGALVLEPNYRGSAGYGEAFRSLNVRNLGVGDMWDVMSGVDALIARGFVDPNRLGSMGWSQGGYISAFLTTNTARFKAISVGAGISDWTTYYVSTDITPFTRQYLHATPWDDPKIYAETSPITNVRKAKTPTLIQHGDKDKRVPVPNAFELYRALRDNGVPAKLILYNGFGHPITKPKSNRAVLQHNWDWFNHYIWGSE